MSDKKLKEIEIRKEAMWRLYEMDAITHEELMRVLEHYDSIIERNLFLKEQQKGNKR